MAKVLSEHRTSPAVADRGLDARDRHRHTRSGGVVVALVVTGSVVAGLWQSVPFASVALALALLPAVRVDLRERRLPDRLLARAVGVAGLVAVAELALGSRLDDVTAGDVVVSVMTMSLPLLALHLIEPSAMGFGDVKLAAILGLAIAPLGASAALVSLLLAGGLGVASAVVARVRVVPFGPALLVGATLALATSSVVTP